MSQAEITVSLEVNNADQDNLVLEIEPYCEVFDIPRGGVAVLSCRVSVGGDVRDRMFGVHVYESGSTVVDWPSSATDETVRIQKS